MRPPFDIYSGLSGCPTSLDRIGSRHCEDARERLREVARIAPRRDCFLCSDDSGIVEIIVHADFQALRRHIDLAKQFFEPRSSRSACLYSLK